MHEFYLKKDTILKEGTTILPNTLSFFPNTGITATQKGGNLKLINNLEEPIKVKLRYRVASYDLEKSGSIIDSTDIDQELRLKLIGADYDVEDYTARRIIQSNKLEYSGSFSRGVSFGNAQDVVLNSNFNMQLLGDLGNGLSVRAAISDESIPIQPEGNTQVLQEFDKIFIEVEKNRTALVAGDYELSRPDSYFMNYYKKLKGISLRTTQNLGKGWTTSNKGSFAVSRGKFRRQTLETREGNQGPYRLTGIDNEIYLQVLSGTEKVFADGQLLKRGETNDYVIDYNRAEIRFTSNRVITDNLRIIVEFEYAVQSYLRSLYATETVIENDRTSFKINLYNEQDSKSLANNLELDTTDLRILTQGGSGELFTSGIFAITPETSNDIIRYNNRDQNYLVYEPEDSINVVGALFSNVGTENGSYIIDTQSGANGRVYRYVGESMGSYDPLIKLVAPERKQLITFSAGHRIADSTNVYIETGISNNDKNRFSEFGNEQNIGTSIFGKIDDYRAIKRQWKLQTNASIEIAQKNFRALNPYRVPEFVRDWNLTDLKGNEKERLFNSSVKLSNENSFIRYSLSGFNEDSIYDGIRHTTEANFQKKSWYVNLLGDWLESESSKEKTFFSRPRATLRKSFFENKLTLGTYFEKERNVRRNISDNSLVSSSFNYDLNRVFAESNISENLKMRLGYSKRTDKLINNKFLEKSSVADNYEFGGTWTKGIQSALQWQLTYRTFNVEESFLDRKTPNKAFIGNLDHKLKVLNNGLTLNTFYESTSGQEPKLEFQYIRVQDGEGSYQWIDYNQDSIQQVTEFEISNFSDQGQYERISIFNNEFISTNRNVVNQALKIEPQRFINNKKSLLGKFIFTSRYRVDEKSLNEGDNNVLRFANFNFRDTALVAFTSSFDHNIFFNRGNPEYDVQLAYRSLNSKIRQISGSELRLTDQYYSRIRVNLKKKLDAVLEGALGQKERESENFSNQNFFINFWNLSPQINYRPSTKMRIVLKYKYEINKNTLGSEQSTINDGGVEFTWRQDSNSNLYFNFNYVDINFTGNRNTTIEFEMLQGLRNGRNLVWNFNYTRRISSNIDLILNYNGRKSEDSRLIHNMGMQMRAIF